MMGKIFHPPGAFRFPRDLHGHWTTLHATVPGTEGWSSSWSPSSVAAFHLLISQDLNWCSVDFLIDVMFKSAGCYAFIETNLLNVLNAHEWFIVWSEMNEYSMTHTMMQELCFLVMHLVSTGCFQHLHFHHNRVSPFFSGTLFSVLRQCGLLFSASTSRASWDVSRT